MTIQLISFFHFVSLHSTINHTDHDIDVATTLIPALNLDSRSTEMESAAVDWVRLCK